MKAKLIASLIGATVLVGCGQDSMQVQRSDNGAEAALIAVVEDCRLWRVKDYHPVYVAVCDGKSADVNSRVLYGKNGTRPQYTIGANQ